MKSFGTEGRRGNPAEEIAPSDNVFEYIVFRGSDVKDLQVFESPTPVAPPAPQVPNDPAILGVFIISLSALITVFGHGKLACEKAAVHCVG